MACLAAITDTSTLGLSVDLMDPRHDAPAGFVKLRLVDSGWGTELTDALRTDTSTLRIV